MLATRLRDLWKIQPEKPAPESHIEYKIGAFSILLPADHMLPTYQREHPNYDRFLPHLAKYFAGNDTIIDVGANVGDTLAGMATNNVSSSYICLEADDEYFELLLENLHRIHKSKDSLVVQARKYLVGNQISGVSMEGKGGTKHAVLNGGGLVSKPIDTIIGEFADIKNVRLLKTDVDGFDYDVIDSAHTVISTWKPIIYFECDYDTDLQLSCYGSTLRSLEKYGYCNWTIFDNFGGVMLRTGNIDIIFQLMRYIWNQNKGKSTRTVYYLDLLATHHDDIGLIDRVLTDYMCESSGNA